MWYVLVFLLCIQKCTPQFQYLETEEISYQLAGIFSRDAITEQSAFNESFRHVNIKEIKIQPITLSPLRTDSYSVWRELCSNNAMQPIVIFGPQSPISDGSIRDQCAKANIPHLQATWQPIDPDFDLLEVEEEENAEPEGEEVEVVKDGGEEEEGEEGQEKETPPENAEEEEAEEPVYKPISINFYPNSEELALAYGKLIKYYEWESFAVLYEDNFGLMRVQKMLAEVSKKSRISVYRLEPGGDNHKIFKLLKTESRMILDCHADRIERYMKEAEELKILNDYQHTIIVSMDTTTVAEKLTKLPCNVTWLSLTEYDSIKDAKHNLAPRVGKWNTPKLTSVAEFRLESLILDDVANHVMKALKMMEDLQSPSALDCNSAEPWSSGALLQQKILEARTLGVTGNVEFNSKGQRKNYVLYVNEINVKNRQTVGRWESANPSAIIDTRPEPDESKNAQTSKHFIVISRRAKPYFYEKEECKGEDCVEVDPKNKWEGFSVDLVEQIFHLLKEEKYNYTYEFVYEEDKPYGKYDKTKNKWNGLIGDLLDKKADLAVCDLTITEERKRVVDFSVPFMTLGISILFTKEEKMTPPMFSFLNPYDFTVWIHTATAYLIVSIVLFICARISPEDWENPEPCEKDPEELENIWTFKNCTWLTMGSIMTQGCDILPKAFGTRWICSMWWFFAVIVCQTYIAQLSASMTTTLGKLSINSVDDLAKQTKILYGCVDGGSTLEFFRSSKDKNYQRIYETMKANDVVLLKSNEEGVERVKRNKNKFAFFMESCTIEYKLKRDCKLQKIGGELDSKDYGIAMPANSPYRTHINRAILKLRERTILDQIKNKWWDQKYGAITCDDAVDQNDLAGDLEMVNLIGAFIVLFVGLGFSLIITAFEFTNEVRNIVVREQVTHKEAFVKELKASLNFFQHQKPVLRNPSRAPSIISTESDDRRQQKRTMNALENFLESEKEGQ